jgi:hypothetical protein
MDFRQTRQDIMVLVNTIKSLEVSSRPISTSITMVETAMMWCGTYLKVSGLGDNPYAKHDGNRKSVKDIEPLFDATNNILVKQGANHIETVDMIRQEIGKVADNIFKYMEDGEDIELVENDEHAEMLSAQALFNCHSRLLEARMWLGMELGRIRDEETK